MIAAEEILVFIEQLKVERIEKNVPYFDILIGIHTGPMIAGIKKFSYDILGDTFNTASRIDSSCEIDKINVSGATYELIKEHYMCVVVKLKQKTRVKLTCILLKSE